MLRVPLVFHDYGLGENPIPPFLREWSRNSGGGGDDKNGCVPFVFILIILAFVAIYFIRQHI